MQKLLLKRGHDRRLMAGHLWVYSNEIDTSQTPLRNFQPGEQVIIETARGKRLCTAYVNPHSLICARLISRDLQPLDYRLIRQRMQHALDLRTSLFDEPYYRMVFGESDLLPGLIVDRFGNHLCVQINTAGMQGVTEIIVEALLSLVKPHSILLKNDSPIREREGLPKEVVVAHGESPEKVELRENGVRFIAPLRSGQKTGWFYDQRSNRMMLRPHVKDKRVLDVFSYIGGFSVQATAFGAREVWAVDGSRSALEMAQHNASLNGAADIFTGAEGDAFHVLKALRQEEEVFDVVIVDPPAFIKKRKDHKEGLQAYHRINDLALRLLAPDGIFFSASCSMHLAHHELVEILRSSSNKQQKHMQIIGQGAQAADHPIHPAIPETSYLKAYLARVMSQKNLDR